MLWLLISNILSEAANAPTYLPSTETMVVSMDLESAPEGGVATYSPAAFKSFQYNYLLVYLIIMSNYSHPSNLTCKSSELTYIHFPNILTYIL